MPDVFEKFFNDFNKKSSDFYPRKIISSIQGIFWSEWCLNQDNLNQIYELFETEEKGSSTKLKQFLKDAE